MNENKQTKDGRFVLFPDSTCQLMYNCNPPGMIKYFDNDGNILRSESFISDDKPTFIYKSCDSRVN